MKEAFIELRTNPPAWINLLNEIDKWDNTTNVLDGFEWNVYTVKNCELQRIYVGFNTFKEAKEYTEKRGYKVFTEDISAELYKAINTKNK